MQAANLAVAAITFAIIGMFHPIVIKTEYYFGTCAWPAFALSGLGFLAAALFLDGLAGIISAVIGCTCLWSILELFEQKKRVEKGWFPEKPESAAAPGTCERRLSCETGAAAEHI